MQFKREFEPSYGVPIEVAPSVLRLTARNPSGFSFYGTNSYIVGSNILAVIDPGPLGEPHFDALLAAIAGRPVSHVFVTHTHIDHSPLADRLARETGALTVAQGPQQRPSGQRGSVSQGNESGFDFGFVPDLVLSDDEVVQGEGWRLQAVFTPGHASNHNAYALAESGILFSGDHVMGWSTTVVSPPDGSMTDYIASLDKLLTRDDRLYLPGHGPAIDGPAPFVRALRTHRLQREGAVLSRLRAGDHRVDEITALLYRNTPEELLGAARRNVWAHLIRLVSLGLARSNGLPTLDALYSASREH